MIAPRHVEGFTRFSRSFIDGRVVLNSNTATPILTYTFDQEDVALWDVDLYNAVRASLAFVISLKTNGKVGITDRLQKQAEDLVAVAQTNDANESSERQDRIPTWIAAAGYEQAYNSTGYFFPYENLSGLAI
jgi:hypothetical protein